VTSSADRIRRGTREVKYAYNSDGKLENVYRRRNNKTQYAYESGSGLLKEFKDPKGNVTTLSYKSRHQQSKRSRWPEVGGKPPTGIQLFAATDTTRGHNAKRDQPEAHQEDRGKGSEGQRIEPSAPTSKTRC